MAKGFTERQVVQSQGPSGQANQPARQLGMVNVNQPRGGSIRQVGADEQVLNQAVKMGGVALKGYLKKKQAKDDVTAAMLKKQGKTEADLKEAGYDGPVLKSFQTLKMKTRYSEWYTKMSHDAVNEHSTLSPDEYRTQVVEPQFAEVLDGLDPEDSQAREVFTALGSEGFEKLIEKQTIANMQYLDADSKTTISNMLFADAGTGEMDRVEDTIANIDLLTEGMSEDSKKEAILGGMVPQLNEGNFLIYDALGGSAGLREAGYSPQQMESVTRAVRRAQTVRESSTDAEFNSAVEGIKLASKEGRIGPQEAQQQLEGIQDEYRTSDEWVRGIVKQVRADSFSDKLEDRQLDILHDPDYTQAIAQLTILAENKGNTAGTTNAALAISEKFDVPRKMVLDNLKLVRDAQDRKLKMVSSNVAKHNKKILEEEEKDMKATTALMADSIHTLKGDEKQRAMRLKREEIGNSTEDDEERMNRHIDFLRTTSVVDESIQADFTEAGAVSPMGSDGAVTEEAENALQYFLGMRQGGLSESIIKKYAGDSYDYFNTAAFLQNGSMDVSKSLLGAWEVTRSDKKQLETPLTKIKDVRKQINKDIDKMFDNIEPGIMSAWFGAASDAKYDEVMTYEVKEAAKNSQDMRDWAVDRAEEYAKMYPDMRSDAISSYVKKDLSRWEYVFGKMVPPKNGQSLSEMMGIEDLPDALSTNSAILHMLHTRKDDLLPEGSDMRSGWDKITDTVGDEFLEAILAPEKAIWTAVFDDDTPFKRQEGRIRDKIGQTLNPLNLSEKRQGILKGLMPLDVTPYGNGIVLITLYHDKDKTKPIGTPIPVNAEMIGADYRNRLK